MGKIIAIDGPSGAGKSSVAKVIAEMLGFRYLDTGALYRAVALGLRRLGLGPEAGDDALRDALRKISVSFIDGRVMLNGQDVSEEIRTTEIGHYSSVFSARPAVRDFLLPLQQEAGRLNDLVAEGRDMTTVVFPEAWKKFYLEANVEARADRRYQQLRMAGVNVSSQGARDDVITRDERDSSRAVAPLRRADDAVYIDSSRLSLEEVVKKVLEAVRS